MSFGTIGRKLGFKASSSRMSLEKVEDPMANYEFDRERRAALSPLEKRGIPHPPAYNYSYRNNNRRRAWTQDEFRGAGLGRGAKPKVKDRTPITSRNIRWDDDGDYSQESESEEEVEEGNGEDDDEGLEAVEETASQPKPAPEAEGDKNGSEVTDPDIEPWGLGPVQPAYQTTKFNDVPPHIMGGAGHYIHQSTYATLTRDAVDKEYPTEVATHYYDKCIDMLGDEFTPTIHEEVVAYPPAPTPHNTTNKPRRPQGTEVVLQIAEATFARPDSPFMKATHAPTPIPWMHNGHEGQELCVPSYYGRQNSESWYSAPSVYSQNSSDDSKSAYEVPGTTLGNHNSDDRPRCETVPMSISGEDSFDRWGFGFESPPRLSNCSSDMFEYDMPVTPTIVFTAPTEVSDDSFFWNPLKRGSAPSALSVILEEYVEDETAPVLTLPTGVTNGDALLNLNELFNTLEF